MALPFERKQIWNEMRLTSLSANYDNIFVLEPSQVTAIQN